MYIDQLNGGKISWSYLSLLSETIAFAFDVKAPTYLQPHYGNGVFANVYFLALNNTKR